jgi:anti-sigma regulatory factor (Ser/Thr protein kinase)
MTGHAGGGPQDTQVETALGTAAGHELRMWVDRQDAAVTVQLQGWLDEPAVVEALLTVLLAGGGSVVCDLRELDYLSPWAVDMILELQCTRPPTPPALALCVTSGQVSRVLAARDRKRFLPLFPDVQEAHRDLTYKHRRAALAFTADPEAAGRSRAFAAGVCAQWSLHTIIDDVVLLVSELVTNAIVHARTKAVLRLARGGGMLSIAVADHAPTALPQTGNGDPLAPGGRGLLLVTGLADTVGSYRTAGGSKVVWCALRLPEAA